MFSWEAPWHSFSNSQAFLIRDCQSHFSVQSHTVDRHRFPQNLIQSWCSIFLVNSPNPKLWSPEKIILHQEKDALPYPRKCQKNKPTNPTSKMNKKPKQKTQTNPHTNTYNRLQSLNCFSLLSDYHKGKSLMKVFNCLLFYKVQNDTSCLMIFVKLTLQAHRLVWVVWNTLLKWFE